MFFYFIKRLGSLLLVLFGITVIAFLLGVVSPGDPAELSLSRGGNYSPEPEQIEIRRKEMGLDKPFYIQYLSWAKNSLRGDFGKSYITNEEVLDILKRRLPITITLSSYSILFTSIMGIILGIISAVYKDKFLDNIIKIVTNVMLSLPVFWLALLFILLFSEKLGILPTSGVGGFKHMLMPSICLSFVTMATTIRLMRGSMIQEFGKPYYIAHKANGITKYRLFIINVLPNAILPIIILLGNFMGSILGGSVVIETIFALPGLGSYAIQAISLKDFPYLQAYVLVTGTIFVTVSFIMDIISILLNPKLRLGDDDIGL